MTEEKELYLFKEIIELEKRVTQLEAENAFLRTGKTPIDCLELTVRSMNCCRNAGIKTVESLKKRLEDGSLAKTRYFGVKSLKEVTEKVNQFYNEMTH